MTFERTKDTNIA